MRNKIGWAVTGSMLSVLGCTRIVDVGSQGPGSGSTGSVGSGGGANSGGALGPGGKKAFGTGGKASGGQTFASGGGTSDGGANDAGQAGDGGGGQASGGSASGGSASGGSASGGTTSTPPPDGCLGAGYFGPESGGVRGVAYSNDGLLYATGSMQEMDLKVFRADNDTLVFERHAHAGATNSVAFSPDGSILASAGEGVGPLDASGAATGVVKLWRTSDGAFLGDIPAHTGRYANGVEFSHDGKLLSTTGMSDYVELWNVSDRSRALSMSYPGTTFGARFSPDDTLLVIPTFRHFAEVRSAADGSVVSTLDGHESSVYDAMFSPDGSEIVTAGSDGTVRIWDTATGAMLQVLPKRPEQPYLNRALWYDPTHLLAGYGDGVLKLWVRGADGMFASDCEQSLGATPTGQLPGLAISPDHHEIRAAGLSDSGDGAGLWTLR